MRHNRLYRHAERFQKLVFIKRPRNTFLHTLDFARRNFGAFAGIRNNIAVFNLHHPIGLRRDFRIVGHHNNGMTFAVQLADDFDHILAAGRIQRAGRLIGQNHLAAVHQRAGNRHPLLLAAGKFAGFVLLFAFQAQAVQQFIRPFHPLSMFQTGIHRRQRHIVAGAQGVQQIVALENKTETLAAQAGQFIRRHLRSFGAVHLIRAGRRYVQTAQNIHQRRFTGTGLADDGDKITFFDAEIHVFQHMNLIGTFAEIAVDVFTLD